MSRDQRRNELRVRCSHRQWLMEPCHRGNALRLTYRDRDRWSAIVRRLSLRKIEYEENFLSRFSSYSTRERGKEKKKKRNWAARLEFNFSEARSQVLGEIFPKRCRPSCGETVNRGKEREWSCEQRLNW